MSHTPEQTDLVADLAATLAFAERFATEAEASPLNTHSLDRLDAAAAIARRELTLACAEAEASAEGSTS